MNKKTPKGPGRFPPKESHLLERIRIAVNSGNYVVTDHAYQRSRDRSIPVPHVEFVLLNGHHEARKDQFNKEFEAWNYAIKGRTPDQVSIRVVVTFSDSDMLVITIINLDV